MTTLMPSLDASDRLLAELRGDPRFTDDDAPSPLYIESMRAITADIVHRARNAEPDTPT
jgi:hypothetical protein